MTFRERVADWISGGALSKARATVGDASRLTDRTFAELHGAKIRASHNHNALMLIAAEEKPTSNATVKRMARIARQAMEGGE